MEAFRDELTGRWSLSGVEPSEVTFERMCKMLKEGENFKFARYGDGEFNCMFGKQGHNCDAHEYFPDLGTALNDAFYSDPEYMVGIQPLSVQGGLYLRATTDRIGPKNIYDADVLHSASIDGKMNLFFDAIKDRRVFMVGPRHLFPFFKYGITIPSINCWQAYDEILVGLIGMLHEEKDNVILFCASMMSEVLIDQLQFSENTLIDCGSVFDPYVGVKSRRYHHKLTLNAS